MGDYFHMISFVDGAYLAWANTLNGEQDVYFTKIFSGFDNVKNNVTFKKCSISAYPNPFSNKTTIRYSLNSAAKVKIVVSDMFGHEITTLVDTRKNAGNYLFNWDGGNLPKGMYICKLSAGMETSFVKIIHF